MSRQKKVEEITRAIAQMSELSMELLAMKGRLAEENKLWRALLAQIGKSQGTAVALSISRRVEKKLAVEDDRQQAKKHGQKAELADFDADAKSDESVDDRTDRQAYLNTAALRHDHLFYYACASFIYLLLVLSCRTNIVRSSL